ncbi:MAG: GNAT family N-acetyltransferase [Prevotella sp.]
MFEFCRYTKRQCQEWNDFLRQSKNATFLFDRNYMDYHAERFEDASVMVFRRGRLYALLPANRMENGVLVSHGGLTYGGLIMNDRATAADICDLFISLTGFLKEYGIHHVIYKPVPWIYHSCPAEEDLYAIFSQCGARLKSRSISTVVSWHHTIAPYRIRQTGLRKAEKTGIVVRKSEDWTEFWELLTENLLNKYHTRPVHSLGEIQQLKQAFPEALQLYAAYLDGRMLAGAVFYVTTNVVHAQYISASQEGKLLHALDLLFPQCMEEALQHRPFFDFGTSTGLQGDELNRALIYQKEGFGGRAVCYDTYEWDI